MILNYIRKIISGWSNYSGKVTSQKIDENKMGYRGSKSGLIIKPVKEQRVDGRRSMEICNSKIFKFSNNSMLLRCTLMGFERSYQVKIPSKQLNKKIFLL